jgi:hypothetical protein
VCSNTPTAILLAATDKDPGTVLSYGIASLPSHGTLEYQPHNPGTVQSGPNNRVVYRADAGFAGDDSFTFFADDGAMAPSGGKSNTATVTLKVRHMVTREYEVIAPADDAYGASGDPAVFCEMLGVGKSTSAMRFRNIDISQSNEIISAYLSICMSTTSIGKRIDAAVYAEATGDANDFNEPALRIPNLPKTKASMPWTWQAGQTWPAQTYSSSPDIRAVIQEIVNCEDWSTSNDIAILYAGNAQNTQDLQFYACDTPYSNRAAKLEITSVMAEREPDRPSPGKEHPPSAKSVRVTVSLNESATIRLEATDDGLPAPPGKLTYTIASLPGHGTLEVPGGNRITTVPLTLTDASSDVVYRPNPDFAGSDSFSFYADDGGTAPTGGKSNTATVTISVRNPASVEQPTCLWLFEEGTGTVASDSAGSRHGTVYGAQWTAGRVGGALAFDGVDDCVVLPYNDPVWLPETDFTLAFWVYFDRGDALQYVSTNEIIVDLNFVRSSNSANNQGSNVQRRSGSRQFCFQMTTISNPVEDLYTNATFDKNRWYHIAAVRNGTQQQIYVNGELDISRDCSPSRIDYTGDLDDDRVNLGTYSTRDRIAGFFKGKLDEVAILYRGLSATEIRQLYDNQ